VRRFTTVASPVLWLVTDQIVEHAEDGFERLRGTGAPVACARD
jgi:hypothetical protein